jgi:carboxyl-terminal processing protease
MTIKFTSRLGGSAIMVAVLSALLSTAVVSGGSLAAAAELDTSITSVTSQDINGTPVDTKGVIDKAKIFRGLPTTAPGSLVPVTEDEKKPAPGTTTDTTVPATPATPAVTPATPNTNGLPPGHPVTPGATDTTKVPPANQTTTTTNKTTKPDSGPTPGVLTPGGMSTKEEIQKMIKLRQDNLRDPAKQPSPEILEKMYRNVWTQIGTKYVDQDKLQDWHLWADKYKGKLKTGEDLQKALKEMVASVGDRWTKFTSFDDMIASMARGADGIVHLGVGLARQADGTFKVEMILYGTPAWESNRLRTGDVVKSIEVTRTGDDGKVQLVKTELKGLTKEQADELTFAKTGSEAVLTIVHDGVEETVKVAFGSPPDAQIDVRMLPGNIGYIRLPSFGSSVEEFGALGQGFTEAVFALDESAHGNMKGLVLDLRNNPGGAVDLAKYISSLFIKEGIFLKTRESDGRFGEEKTIRINKPMPYQYVGMPPEMAAAVQRIQEVPMTVLVNGSSASSAEILTGTLKDNKRAIIIGSQTFGKAVAYIDEPLPPLGQLQVTVMHYLTPSGYDLANKGIEPDIIIDRSRGGAIDEQLATAVVVINQIATDKLAGPAGTPPAHNGEDDFGGTSVLLIGIGLGAGLGLLFFVQLHNRKRKERDRLEKEDRK